MLAAVKTWGGGRTITGLNSEEVKHGNPHLQNAWNLYVKEFGEDVWVFEILEECAPSLLQEREDWWMDVLIVGVPRGDIIFTLRTDTKTLL